MIAELCGRLFLDRRLAGENMRGYCAQARERGRTWVFSLGSRILSKRAQNCHRSAVSSNYERYLVDSEVGAASFPMSLSRATEESKVFIPGFGPAL